MQLPRRRLGLRVVVAAGAITTLTMAAQTVKYAATQADLIAALGNDKTVVLNNTILLETSTDAPNNLGATGILIENVQGLVINGSGFAVAGQGMMRCMYVASADVALELVDDAHRTHLGRSRHRARREGGADRVERV